MESTGDNNNNNNKIKGENLSKIQKSCPKESRQLPCKSQKYNWHSNSTAPSNRKLIRLAGEY